MTSLGASFVWVNYYSHLNSADDKAIDQYWRISILINIQKSYYSMNFDYSQKICKMQQVIFLQCFLKIGISKAF